MTSTTNLPAATNALGFPLVTCSRCDGTGEYSWNIKDGKRCFGCKGAGKVIAKPCVKAWQAFVAARQAARTKLVRDLVVGDRVSGAVGLNYASDGKWATVESITVTDEPCGWTGGRVDDTYRIVQWADGTEKKIGGGFLMRTDATVDPSPFVEQALAAWRKAGCPEAI